MGCLKIFWVNDKKANDLRHTDIQTYILPLVVLSAALQQKIGPLARSPDWLKQKRSNNKRLGMWSCRAQCMCVHCLVPSKPSEQEHAAILGTITWENILSQTNVHIQWRNVSVNLVTSTGSAQRWIQVRAAGHSPPLSKSLYFCS